MAQQYYKKRTSMGGGGNTFTCVSGWPIPTDLDSTANGTNTAVVNAQQVTITGAGTEVGNDGSNPVRARGVVGPSSITVSVTN